MDDLVSNFESLSGKRVLVTGHTGFKGSWLCVWLKILGARVSGFALDPTPGPSVFELAGVADLLENDFRGDLCADQLLSKCVVSTQPEIIFHLAAQPLVRESYRDPAYNWTTNVLGTVSLFEAVRSCPSVRAVVVVTTDKCYENRESEHPYREDDPLGGHDPYSASKACVELVSASYRRSFLAAAGVGVATARAGNVIGGGDFAKDRLIPDAVRAFSAAKPLVLRNPQSTRPWQHVLEPLAGYLILAERLCSNPTGEFAVAWNFGPDPDGNATVGRVASEFSELWGGGRIELLGAHSEPHEAALLQLDNSRAKADLKWQPSWSLHEALQHTADWYRTWHDGNKLSRLMSEQITIYSALRSANSGDLCRSRSVP